MSDCISCDLIARRNRDEAPPWDNILRTEHFDVVHCYGTGLAGWIVLVSKPHLAALDELSEEAASEMGKLIRDVSIALKEITGCKKTYVLQLAEAEGHNHVHVHVIPRHADIPDTHKGVNVFSYMKDEEVSEAERNDIAAQLKQKLG